jgi:hypothetical protein
MMHRLKRKDALVLLRVAGYHSDSKTFTRLYVENRVSKPAANAEWDRGAAMRAAGVPCTCPTCREAPTAKTSAASISN